MNGQSECTHNLLDASSVTTALASSSCADLPSTEFVSLSIIICSAFSSTTVALLRHEPGPTSGLIGNAITR
eukprot:scaffold638343_cov17-Prasinocladus_malaysianus.AAC.1